MKRKSIAILSIAAILAADIGVGVLSAYAQTNSSLYGGTDNSTSSGMSTGTDNTMDPNTNIGIGYTSTSTYYGTGTNGAAGTTTNGSTTTIPAAPGVPNTGAGGNAPMNDAVLIASGVVALGAATYLVRSLGFRKS